MNKNLRRRLGRTLVLCVLGLAIGIALGWLQVRNDGTPALQPVAGVQAGGPFTLVDHEGRTITEKDFAGRYKLIYFGFTYCPAICPAELQKMAAALKNLDPEEQDAIQPLFITVDPERDTAPVLKSYVGMFHPRLIGLTGSKAQVEAALKAYKVFARKAQDPGMNDYTMDHSSFIYLMSPQDKLLALYRTQDGASMIARDIATRLHKG